MAAITIEQLADLLSVNLIIQRYANQDNRYTAKLEYTDVCEGIMLVGYYGNAKSPGGAIADYVKKIAGQKIKIGSFEESRYFNVPKDLTV